VKQAGALCSQHPNCYVSGHLVQNKHDQAPTELWIMEFSDEEPKDQMLFVFAHF